MLLHDAFLFHARGRGGSEFSRFEGRTLTYADAARRVEALRAALAGAGLRRGDRFGMIMKNAPDLLLLVFAASISGLVPVPLNTRLAPAEWVDLLVDAEARAVIADAAFVDALEPALPRDLAIARVCSDGAAGDWPSLDDVAAAAVPPSRPEALTPDDDLLQMYTSGTTGRAKGAVLTHRSVVANVTQYVAGCPYKLSPGDRALVVLPLFHIAALSTALVAVSTGAALVIHRDVQPAEIARTLAEDGIAVATLVPAVIQMILVGVPGVGDMRFPDLKQLGYGASPIAEATLRRAMELFGCNFGQGYGMTELSGTCCMLTEADHRLALQGRPELLLSAGRAVPGSEVRIVGPDGADVPLGEVGEVLVRGEQVMSRYWRMPEATAETLRDGWMHTGDAGSLDADGYLFIRDRLKDMIVSGGENVYPAEVEAALFAHPGVADAAVIGVPDERWGETVMAVVVARPPGGLDEAALDAHCRSRLGGFKVPRRYAFVDALPRNASGKVLKRELRREHWPTDGRQVA